jgi:mannose-6-phosphate isomerase-like protein (cupin superfamily)
VTQTLNGATTAAKPQVFHFRAPIHERGGTRGFLAKTENVRVGRMSYTHGGETEMHAHPNEDHVFFVLQGTAILRQGDGTETRLERFDGVLLPAGAFYCFSTEGDEPLIMARFNGWTDELGEGIETERLGADKQPLAIDTNPTLREAVPVPDAFFPKA